MSAAVLPILNQNDILSFGVAPTSDSTDPSKFPLNFDVGVGPTESARGSSFREGEGLRRHRCGARQHRVRRVVGKEMTSALKDAGLEQAGKRGVRGDALDMTAQLQALKNAGAKAIALDAYGAPLGYVLQICSGSTGTCR